MVARYAPSAAAQQVAFIECGRATPFDQALRAELVANGFEVVTVSLTDLASAPCGAHALITTGALPPAATFEQVPCVLVVGNHADDEGGLGLPSVFAPFAAVVAESEAQAHAISRLRGGPVRTVVEGGGWRTLLGQLKRLAPLPESESQSIEVHGTDVTRRLRLVTRALHRELDRRPVADAHLVSIVMLSWDQPHFTERCIASVRAFTSCPYEIILVDNGSARETVERVHALPDVFIANPRNEGFARANNQGLARARGDIIVFLNNDTEVNRGWLDGVVDLALRDDVGIVAPAVSDAGGWVSVRTRPTGVVRDLLPFTEPPPAVCYVSRTEAMRRLQGFSEIYPLGSGEDVDLCFKVWWEGLRVLVDERNVIFHAHGGSTREKLKEQRAALWSSNRELFLQTWLARAREHGDGVIARTRTAMSDSRDESHLTVEAKNWELPRDLLFERRLYARYIAELSLQIQQLEKKREADMKNIVRDREKFAAKLQQLEQARLGPAHPDQDEEREITQLRGRWGKRLSKLEREVLLARSLTGVLAVVLMAMLANRLWPTFGGRWLWGVAAIMGAAIMGAGHFAWRRKRAALKMATNA